MQTLWSGDGIQSGSRCNVSAAECGRDLHGLHDHAGRLSPESMELGPMTAYAKASMGDPNAKANLKLLQDLLRKP